MGSFNDIISSETPTLVDFHATWCGPCKTMSPIIDQIKNELGKTVRILKVDVDKNQALSTQFKVRGVPTFILFKAGEIQWRQSGAMAKSVIVTQIQRAISA